MATATLITGDAKKSLAQLQASSIQTCVTSPPYWGLRDYGVEDQLGLEGEEREYISNLMNVFDEVHRVLADDGTLWLNLGDSYSPSKQLRGMPWKVALALQERGWLLRQDIIWHKPNPMPESVKDRCTKSHEYLFLLAKSPSYFFDVEAIREPSVRGSSGNSSRKKATDRGAPKDGVSGNVPWQGEWRNKRTVWTVASQIFKQAHFAVMPEALAEPCILASTKRGDTVLDPFAGSGTVGVVSLRNERNFIGVELNEQYVKIAEDRIGSDSNLFNKVSVIA